MQLYFFVLLSVDLILLTSRSSSVIHFQACTRSVDDTWSPDITVNSALEWPNVPGGDVAGKGFGYP